MVKLLEYIWLDAAGNPRSKTRLVGDTEGAGRWSYDGSSTGQATTERSEIGLLPAVILPDPLRAGLIGSRVGSTGAGEAGAVSACSLVLCDLLDNSGNLIPTSRTAATHAFAALPAGTTPWFGFEQEYYIMDPTTGLPLGYTGHPPASSGVGRQPQGEFYCGTQRGRALAEEHMMACLAAGLGICGVNAEVGPGQWEFQIGPVLGPTVADQVIIARYLLVRLAEKHGVRISFHPKPLPGYNGSGLHANFSTAGTRNVDGARSGTQEITRIVRRLEAGHTALMATGYYGTDNHLRLIGTHETSSMERFSWGPGDRSASVRVGMETWMRGAGYFEDRRPAANADPYRVVEALLVAARAE
jgi:glutamine synthetase